MAFEDLQNDYTLGGAQQAVLSPAANACTFTQFERQDEAWLQKSHGADHFNGDFTHTFKLKLTAENGVYPMVLLWLLANQIDSWDDIRTENDDTQDINIYVGKARLGVVEDGVYRHSDTANSLASDSTQYYITVERDDDGGANGTGQLTMRIHTVDYFGEAGSIELETETIDCSAGEQNDFQYFYPCNQYVTASLLSYYSGVCEDYNLHEGAPPAGEPSRPPMFINIMTMSKLVLPFLFLVGCLRNPMLTDREKFNPLKWIKK